MKILKQFKYWDVLDEIPEGWKEDKTCGSPLAGAIFITNGKSILNGQKRALLLLKKVTETSKEEITKNNEKELTDK